MKVVIPIYKYDFRVFTEPRTFRSFLQQHINLAFARGFDDNVSRHSTPAHFEVDVCKLHLIIIISEYNK